MPSTTIHQHPPPGFGGQSFQAEMRAKARCAGKLRDSLGASYDTEVDGGSNAETAHLSLDSGANVLVARTSISTRPIARPRAGLCAADMPNENLWTTKITSKSARSKTTTAS